jgi:hypothetical protein
MFSYVCLIERVNDRRGRLKKLVLIPSIVFVIVLIVCESSLTCESNKVIPSFDFSERKGSVCSAFTDAPVGEVKSDALCGLESTSSVRPPSIVACVSPLVTWSIIEYCYV